MSRRTITVLAGLAVLAAAVTVAAGCSGGGGSADAERAAAMPSGGGELAVEAGVTSAAQTSAELPAADAVGEAAPLQPAELGPQVIQTASVAVTVARGDFEETVDRARVIAAGLGGFVTSSSASQGDGQRLVRGTLVLRVPSTAYSRAMTQLAKLGRVESREETGEDVSAQFVDLRARAGHLEAVETQLLGFLDRTKTVPQALAVQSRLNDVQLQLEQVRGQLRYLDDQTAYATISLSVSERGIPVAKPGGDDGWGISDAWHSAVRGLEKVAGGLFVALVTAGPFLLALVLAFSGGRALLRRRRSRIVAASPTAPTATPPA